MSQPTDPGYPGDCPHASTPGWCPACVARLLAERDHAQELAIANGAALESMVRPFVARRDVPGVDYPRSDPGLHSGFLG